MVRRELDRDPDVALDVLIEKAKGIDPSAGELTPRQFHARYPLQIKRSRNRASPRKGRKEKGGRKRAARAGRAAEAPPAKRAESRRPAASERDAIRNVFLAFASDFAKAESRQEIVGVLGSIDVYVDRVQKLMGK